jgi:hypothetical protein
MTWKIIDRRIGRAGSYKARIAKQKEWDKKYGEGNWEVGYVVNGVFISQNEALETIYYKSYKAHFEKNPDDLKELISLAKKLNNPHAVATTGVDLQVPAIMKYLQINNMDLKGDEVVDIGTWQGEYSHKISVRLSPLHIKCIVSPKMTLEKFWQNKKCLAIWSD